ERPREQLVHESGLVRRTPGGVEGGLIGTVQRLQLLADEGEGLLPFDRGVVRGTGPLDHRMRDAALLAEPQFTVGSELGDAVPREELGIGASLGALLGDGLGTVLAEFSD